MKATKGVRKSLQKCNEDRRTERVPNGGKCRGSMRKKQIWAASIKLVCYFSPYFDFFPLILAYLAIILVFSSNPTHIDKAVSTRENCKEIL